MLKNYLIQFRERDPLLQIYNIQQRQLTMPHQLQQQLPEEQHHLKTKTKQKPKFVIFVPHSIHRAICVHIA